MGRLISSWYREGEVLARDVRRQQQTSRRPNPNYHRAYRHTTNTLIRECHNDGTTRESSNDLTQRLGEEEEDSDEECDNAVIWTARRVEMEGVRMECPRLVNVTTTSTTR